VTKVLAPDSISWETQHGAGPLSEDVRPADVGVHGPCNVRELLDQYQLMSIPHFQRGLVWDSSSVALLLESLYYGTPCGSIILWAPSDVAAQGTQLQPGTKNPMYLIIDGQQRVRTLHAAFADRHDQSTDEISDEEDIEGEAASDDDENEKENRVWCLNLGRLPETEEHFPGGKRFHLFRLATDPRKRDSSQRNLTGALLHDQEALLPLKWFLDSLDQEAAARPPVQPSSDPAIAKAVKAVRSSPSVMESLRQMRIRRVFHLSTLPTDARTGKPPDLATVVGVYRRINSAGKRVEPEEIAFANLVAQYSDASSSLQRFFDAVHRANSKPKSVDFPRDDLLRRQKENSFGFKLFMRSFVMALAYHSDLSLGSDSFSFDSANPQKLAKFSAQQLAEMLDDTVALLRYVALIILREPPLCCDDLRMLPETASLWPLFQLLIRFPGLMSNGKDTLKPIALRLLLLGLPKPRLLALARQVTRAKTVEAALEVLGTADLRPRMTKKAIARGVEKAQSLTSRYTLLTYWLLRSRMARDFSYDQNAKDPAALRHKYGAGAEPELTDRLAPQKQHLIPYASLKVMFGLKGARLGRHEVNDLGNLTYISAGLNGWERGVGANSLDLAAEPTKNREAHLVAGRACLTDYRAILANPKSTKKKYRSFCRRRRNVIKLAFVAWERSVSGLAPASVDDVEAAPRKTKLTVNRDNERTTK
jgi:hypothetical protein